MKKKRMLSFLLSVCLVTSTFLTIMPVGALASDVDEPTSLKSSTTGSSTSLLDIPIVTPEDDLIGNQIIPDEPPSAFIGGALAVYNEKGDLLGNVPNFLILNDVIRDGYTIQIDEDYQMNETATLNIPRGVSITFDGKEHSILSGCTDG